MAYVKLSVDNTGWVLIGDNVSEITFQNSSAGAFYINFTSNSSPPDDEVGLVYGPWQGELKKPLEDMTNVISPSRVWAKAISRPVNIIVEQ